MRSVAIKWMCCVFLPFACSDDNSDSLTSNGPMSQPTSAAATMTTDSTTNPSGSSADPPTGGTATGGASMTGATEATPTTSTGPDATTMAVDPSSSTRGPNPTTTTGDESSSSGGTTTEDVPCEMVQALLARKVPNLMLVLDKGGSMVVKPGGFWDHDADMNTPQISRWHSLHDALDAVLTKFAAEVNFGANLFPSMSALPGYEPGACTVNADVEVPVAPNNKDTILANIPAALDVTLKGSRPTSAGVKAAIAHLKTLPVDAPRAVLLVTNRSANCTEGAGMPGKYEPLFEAYDDSLHTAVSDAFTKHNIATYVVGIATTNVVSPVVKDGDPDSINPFVKLNELAVQGGKPRNDPNEQFYNATTQSQLAAALDLIVADASCVLPLESVPAKPELTTVTVQGAEVKHVMDCAQENGWVYTHPNGPYDAIQLCGTACTDLAESGQAEVNFCAPN